MNDNALRYFLAAVQAGSIRAAADALQVAQSVMSRQIAGLERELGAQLLERRARGVVPTGPGEILLRHGRESLNQIAQARAEIGALQGLRTGQVRLATIDIFADTLLPRCITRFAATHPGITFEMRVGGSQHVLQMVQDGFVELGIVYNVATHHGVSTLLSLREPLEALCPPTHPLAQRKTIGIAQLRDMPLILPPPHSPSRLFLERAARTAKVTLTPVLESDSVPLRLAAAAALGAIAVLAGKSASLAAIDHGLVRVPFRERALNNGQIELIHQEGRTLSHASAAFQVLLQSVMRGLVRR